MSWTMAPILPPTRAKHPEVLAAAVETPRAEVVAAAASLARTAAAADRAAVADLAATVDQVVADQVETNSVGHVPARVGPAVSLETVQTAADAATAE